MYRKEVPKLNKVNFLAWKSLMKLHLGGLGDYSKSTINTENVEPTRDSTLDDLKKKKEHNQAMLKLASTLSYSEFDDIKGCNSTKKMWDVIEMIYGGDKNVMRAKSGILRGKFNDMRMEDGENIVQYFSRIKDVVNVIRGANGIIDDDTILRKVLRNFFLYENV